MANNDLGWAWKGPKPPAPPSNSKGGKRKGKKGKRREGRKFYLSGKWRALRYQVLKERKGCCDLCGRSYRKHGVAIHVDHIKPKSTHPWLALDKNNLQCLCEDCNLGKSNRDETDWREADESSDLSDELQLVVGANQVL